MYTIEKMYIVETKKVQSETLIGTETSEPMFDKIPWRSEVVIENPFAENLEQYTANYSYSASSSAEGIISKQNLENVTRNLFGNED